MSYPNTTTDNEIVDKVTEYVNKILVLKLPKEQLVKRILSMKNVPGNTDCIEADVTDTDILMYIFTKPLIYRLPSVNTAKTGPDDLTKDELFMVQVYAFDRVIATYPWLKDTAEELKYLYCTSF